MVHVSSLVFCPKITETSNRSGVVNWYKTRQVNFEDEKEYVADPYYISLPNFLSRYIPCFGNPQLTILPL